MKINANFKAFAGINFDASKFVPSPAYNVNRFMLDRIGNEKARATTIVEYKPNSKFPLHEHIGGEEFLVLKGTFKDQYGEFPKGYYVRNPIGSKHEPWVDDDGCTIMVKLLQMADTDEGVDPLHINYEGSKDKEKTDWGHVLEMYHNKVTGERVSMWWVDPGTEFPTNEYCSDGEELFIVDGSLFADGHEYVEWGWIRFPPGKEVITQRKGLKSGPAGAQVYRKTGHLTDSAMSMEKIQISIETEEVLDKNSNGRLESATEDDNSKKTQS